MDFCTAVTAVSSASTCVKTLRTESFCTVGRLRSSSYGHRGWWGGSARWKIASRCVARRDWKEDSAASTQSRFKVCVCVCVMAMHIPLLAALKFPRRGVSSLRTLLVLHLIVAYVGCWLCWLVCASAKSKWVDFHLTFLQTEVRWWICVVGCEFEFICGTISLLSPSERNTQKNASPDHHLHQSPFGAENTCSRRQKTGPAANQWFHSERFVVVSVARSWRRFACWEQKLNRGMGIDQKLSKEARDLGREDDGDSPWRTRNKTVSANRQHIYCN